MSTLLEPAARRSLRQDEERAGRPPRRATLTLPAAGAPLYVRSFEIEERISRPFVVRVTVATSSPDLDVSGCVGAPATLALATAHRGGEIGERSWEGIVAEARSLFALAEGQGESRYRVTIVPRLWLLGLGRDHRIFQHKSVVEIVGEILHDWNVDHEWRVDRHDHPRRPFRIQYGESDLGFVSRLLEQAGIAYFFDKARRGTRVVLADRPGAADLARVLPFEHEPAQLSRCHVSAVELVHRATIDAVALRDVDFLRPDYALGAEARLDAAAVHAERYVYAPDESLAEARAGGETPVADDEGAYRHRQEPLAALAQRLLEAERAHAAEVLFHTTDLTMAPGDVVAIDGHALSELEGRRLLVERVALAGALDGAWSIRARSLWAERPYRPSCKTARPRITGVQSATVVGPPGEEVHTDEHGRVRVRFPWDRRAARGHDSSMWLRVSYPSAGAGYGHVVLPQVGQEVLVAFVDGDPDAPVVVGRVFNARCPVPYKLPEQKLVSAWKGIPRRAPARRGAGGGHGPRAQRVASNELGSDDGAASQLLFLRAVDAMSVEVNGARTSWIGADERASVDGHQSLAVGGSHRRTIGSDEHALIGRLYRLEMAEGPMTLIEMRSDAIALHTSGASVTLRERDLRVSAAGHLRISAGGDMEVTAGGRLTLRGGLIELNPPAANSENTE